MAGRPQGRGTWSRLVLALLVAAQLIVMVPPPAGGTGTVAFGATPGGSGDDRIGELNEFESLIGRRLDFVRVFELWDSPFPSAYHDLLVDSDHKMLLSVRAKRRDGSFVPWRDIADAQPGSPIHGELVAWVQAVGNLGVPVWFTFNHEPEVVENIANGTDQDFVDAWRRVVDEFAVQGVTNAEFVWIMTDHSFRVPATDRRHAPLWYPGDDVVDAIAADAYNYSDCRPAEPVTWRSLESLIDDLRLFGLDHPDKDLILAEWASTEEPGDGGAAKAAWIDAAAQLFAEPGWEQFIAVSYFNFSDPGHPACIWDLDSTAPALSALQEMAADPHYGGGSPPPGGVIYVVAEPAAVTTDDAVAIARLESLGEAVSVVDDDGLTAGDAAGYDLVFVSSTTNTTALASTFAHSSSPVWVAKPWLLDDMAMTGPLGGTDYGTVSATDVTISDPAHPLAAGLTGTVPFTTSSRLTQFGLPGGDAATVATVAGLPTSFVYEPGDLLADGSLATGCRLAFSVYQNAPSAFTVDAWSMFEATAVYALNGCGSATPNDPPVVTVTAPVDGATVSGIVTITADATDADGVAQVDFFADGASIGVDTDGTDGWTATWQTASTADGADTAVSASATDSLGATSTSSVSVTVDNDGPTVAMITPVDGATVSGIVTITADATDAVGMSQVEFLADGARIGIDADGTDGWTMPWDTNSYLDGSVVDLTATGTDTGGATASDTNTVTVDASTTSSVVMIVASPGSLSGGEDAVVGRLQSLGAEMSIVDDDAATPSTADGVALVLVSSTANSNTLSSTFASVSTPVWVAKPWLLDDMKMTGPIAGTDYGTVSAAQVTISDPSHPMAAGLSGTVPFTTGSRLTQFGLPGGDAATVATVAGLPTSFVYESGSQLVDGSLAPGCRLALSVFQGAPTVFTAEAWALFDATAIYAMTGCTPVTGNGPPAVSMTSPLDGTTVAGTLTVAADATDPDGVAQVEFFADGVSIGVDTNGTDGWTTTWDTSSTSDGVDVGVWATATDTLGASSSAIIEVTVDNDGPDVTIVAPADGATVSGVVTITADASDAVGMSQVEFFADGASIGIDADGTDGWTTNWDTAIYSDGTMVTLSATATDTAGATATASHDVTVDASVAGMVLLVVGKPDSLGAGEIAVIERLQSLGAAVSTVDDNQATPSMAGGVDLVIVSSTINSNVLNTTFAEVTIPVWVSKPWLLDDMAMTAENDYGTTSATETVIADSTHPLAAGYSGVVMVTTSPKLTQYGIPGSGATTVATVDGSASSFVYEAGDLLVEGTSAPGCRIAYSLFQSAPTKFSSDGWALFDATATYALGGCGG